MAFTPALITLLGLSISLFVNDMNVTSFISSRYFVLSLNTGPIMIFTPSSYNSLETFNASIGLDLVSFGIISIWSSLILFIAILIDFIILSPMRKFSPLSGTINPILILSDAYVL